MTTKHEQTDAELADRFEQLDTDHANIVVRDRAALADIESAVAARRSAEDRVTQSVNEARANGVTWVEIASALQVTHQAARQRYGRDAPAKPRRLSE